ncbi:MAG: hypothetical protein AseanaTS_10770 [Candidatus Pelagadaptatus aseana]|uniref:imelysin family protein n=1 Tax=Candidatus Pelagadaptatus aseana TaxID=3120508 RepID=UPI0039B2FAEE
MTLRLTLLSLAMVLFLSGCEPRNQEATLESGAQSSSADADDLKLDELSRQLWQHQTDSFAVVIGEAERLSQRIAELNATPDDEQLQAARQQWHQTHNQLLRSSSLISFGAINPGLFQQIKAAMELIDSHPIQPGYLDYFDVYQHSGIVNDIAVPITADAIRKQHGFSDGSDVSLGFHAMAYLLWGEQGSRPASDFLAPQKLEREQQLNGLKLVDLPNHRRATLLQLQATLLVDDLKSLHYRLSHQASALNGAYLSLMPRSRIQLWQQSSLHLLQKILAQPFLLPEDSESLERADPPHNQFSGQELEAIRAVIHGMTDLLFAKEPETPSLAQQLVREDTPALRRDFGKFVALLDKMILEQAVLQDNRANLRQTIEALAQRLGGNLALAGQAQPGQHDRSQP